MSYLLCFHQLGFTERALRKLLEKRIDLKSLWINGEFGDIQNIIGTDSSDKYLSIWRLRNKDVLDCKILPALQACGANFIILNEGQYPFLLSQISDPPPILYYKGNVSLFNSLKSLAVVGSRRMTGYGKKCIEHLIPGVAGYGITIVSGMALGVDEYAHLTTIKNKGKTIGVLGCGIDIIYPPSNRYVYQETLNARGLIVSAFYPGTEPFHYNFPIRNRIISGLSNAVLIVEASLKSGSLITARCALDQNRDVMIVPGDIFREFSMGANGLWKEGAVPVWSGCDILKELGVVITESGLDKSKTAGGILDKLSDSELKLWDKLEKPVSPDEIIREMELDVSTFQTLISKLEIYGLVHKNSENGLWERKSAL